MKILKLIAGLMGISLAIPPAGAVEPVTSSKEEQPAMAKFTKEQLIDSLKKMSSRPQDIKTVCAMCYKMMIPPKEVEYHCKACGNVSTYERNSDQGALTEQLPYIERSLATMPYGAVVDASGLCSKCGNGKDKDLSVTVSCFNCGKKFNWEIRNSQDLESMYWLYLKPPITEVDTHYMGMKGNGPSEISKGAVYIRDHVFCPECRKKININE
ncbi:MAG: hypothetical protein WCY23_07135 [Candidatus Omnitrophota bacterium]